MADGSSVFAVFMASGMGRHLRMVAGIAIVGRGWSMHEGTVGMVLPGDDGMRR